MPRALTGENAQRGCNRKVGMFVTSPSWAAADSDCARIVHAGVPTAYSCGLRERCWLAASVACSVSSTANRVVGILHNAALETKTPAVGQVEEFHIVTFDRHRRHRPETRDTNALAAIGAVPSASLALHAEGHVGRGGASHLMCGADWKRSVGIFAPIEITPRFASGTLTATGCPTCVRVITWHPRKGKGTPGLRVGLDPRGIGLDPRGFCCAHRVY
jgi:hypothetical protein